MKEKIINWIIKFLKADTNKISDGYHTFDELYEHRIWLWIALCRQMEDGCVWKTKVHSDGSVWKGWFILGTGGGNGDQITYHLPIKYWKLIPDVKTIRKAPDWDGHTPKEVIKRLKFL